MAKNNNQPLKQTEAESRFLSISQPIQYRCFYNFRSGTQYDGLTEILFTYTPGQDIWIDWQGDEVLSLRINSIICETFEFDGSRIHVKEKVLADGVNTITLHFKNTYSTDGSGLVTYTDGENQQYLYTQTEPYFGNRVCPLFDQPDLKATFELFAIGDPQWQIITGEHEKEHSTFAEFKASQIAEEDPAHSFLTLVKDTYSCEADDRKYFRFLPTVSLSTYLNNIVAGPYKRFDCPPEKCYRGISMAVYCRQNMAEYAEASLETIFEFHAKGIEFYEKFFSFNYTFSKCDAIFCCNYLVGAMEYPGAITYNESIYLLKKTELSKFETSNRGRVILHELAHMWFGNTVTMKWWNDLWLNESFADFCCFTAWDAISDSLSFTTSNSWVCFLNRKAWAFKEDQERTTHPIAAHVENTDMALSIFDGITYPKGAMVMRQLLILLSQETFSKALGGYFQKHAFKNTLLQDLLDACKETIGDTHEHPAYNIDQWKVDWLDSPGMNSITSDWDPTATGVASLTIRQSAASPDYPTLRYHKICVGFFGEDGQVLEEKEIILNNSEITTVEYNADLHPKGVFLNLKDWTFIKIVFDEHSKKHFLKRFDKLDILSKCLYIRSLFDETRDAIMAASEFVEIVSNIFKQEDNSEIINFSYSLLNSVISSYMPAAEYSANISKLFNLTVGKLLSTDDFDTIGTLKAAFFAFLYSEDDIEVAKQYLEGTHALVKHPLSISDKWSIVYKIVASGRYTQEEKTAAIETLKAQDNTDTKLKYSLKIKALTASSEERRIIFASFVSCTEHSFEDQRALMTGFKSKHLPEEVRSDYISDYFDNLLAVHKSVRPPFWRNWKSFLYPSTSNKALMITKLKEVLEKIDPSNKTLRKDLLQKLDNEEREARALNIEF